MGERVLQLYEEKLGALVSSLAQKVARYCDRAVYLQQHITYIKCAYFYFI
jgi:hypothetical protein